PGVLIQHLLRGAVEPARLRSAPTRVFPLRLARQPIPRPRQVVCRQLQRRGAVLSLLDVGNTGVAHLVFRHPLLLAQPATILRRLVPRHGDDRAARLRAVLLRVGVLHLRVRRQETLELCYRHLLARQGNTTPQPAPVQRLVGLVAGFVVGRAHQELAWAGKQYHRLPLPVDVPTPTPATGFAPQRLVDLRQFLRLSPDVLARLGALLAVPQQPVDRRVNARIGVVSIPTQQTRRPLLT